MEKTGMGFLTIISTMHLTKIQSARVLTQYFNRIFLGNGINRNAKLNTIIVSLKNMLRGMIIRNGSKCELRKHMMQRVNINRFGRSHG
jgi:hypothetical protein